MICQVYQGIILSGDPLLVSGFLSVSSYFSPFLEIC